MHSTPMGYHKEVMAMNPIEQVSSLLTNLVISNDLVEPVKLAQV